MNFTISADICIFNNKPVISTYKATLETFNGVAATLPFPLTKLCTAGEHLLGISHTYGVLLVLDSEFRTVGKLEGLNQPLFIASEGGRTAICLSREVLIYDNECKDTESKFIPIIGKCIKKIKLDTGITGISLTRDKICIGDDKMVLIFEFSDNSELHEIFRKEFSVCINAVSMKENRIAVGLINGKIHYLDVLNTEEGFVFNSHRRILNTKEGVNKNIAYLNCPVTQLELGEFLISSGYDGKILKWDLNSKRQVGVLLESEGYVRKFVGFENEMYSLVENSACEADGNKIIKQLIN